MLDKYKEKQSMFCNFIMTSFKNDKISHAYLIETNDVSYADDLALDLAKFFLFDGVFDEKLNTLIDKNNYANLIIIDGDKEVKKDAILDLKLDFSLKTVDGKRKVYVIKDVTLLNKYSANSLLKFLEEPDDDIIAILMTPSVDKVLSTITSRTQIISLIREESFDYKHIFALYYDENSDVSFDEFVLSEEKLILDFYNNLENKGVEILENNSIYDIGKRFKEFLLYGLYLYFDALNLKINRDNSYYVPDSLVKDNIAKNEINDIINKIEVINDFLYLINFNVNMNLFIDNFVISIGG